MVKGSELAGDDGSSAVVGEHGWWVGDLGHS